VACTWCFLAHANHVWFGERAFNEGLPWDLLGICGEIVGPVAAPTEQRDVAPTQSTRFSGPSAADFTRAVAAMW
jgi:hypothetical protein